MAAKRQPFELIYDSEVVQHVKAIERKYHSLTRSTIEEQLSYEPEVETHNRKPLLRPSVFSTAWELRFGHENRFRVFYRTDTQARQVHILAIGVKLDNILSIDREEFEL